MKKESILKRLEDMRLEADGNGYEDIQEILTDELFDVLLDYINDKDIREAFERIPR